MRSVFLSCLKIAKRRVSHTIDYKQKRKGLKNYMSCYNRQYTGMPDYSGYDSPMSMPAWQAWQCYGNGNVGNVGNMGNMANTGNMENMGNAGNPLEVIQPDNSFCPDSGNYPLAMSYVPMQRWTQPLPIETAITRGTIFKELDLPFEMGGCR